MPSGHVLNAIAMLTWISAEVVGAGRAGDYAGVLAATTLLLFPVPWARLYNLDHTYSQVTVKRTSDMMADVNPFN